MTKIRSSICWDCGTKGTQTCVRCGAEVCSGCSEIVTDSEVNCKECLKPKTSGDRLLEAFASKVRENEENRIYGGM